MYRRHLIFVDDRQNLKCDAAGDWLGGWPWRVGEIERYEICVISESVWLEHFWILYVYPSESKTGKICGNPDDRLWRCVGFCIASYIRHWARVWRDERISTRLFLVLGHCHTSFKASSRYFLQLVLTERLHRRLVLAYRLCPMVSFPVWCRLSDFNHEFAVAQPALYVLHSYTIEFPVDLLLGVCSAF